MKRLPDTRFQRFLKRIGACLEARRWVGNKGIHEAWRKCRNGYWLLWIMDRCGSVSATLDANFASFQKYGYVNRDCALWCNTFRKHNKRPRMSDFK